jgi:hypothetical protein
LRRDEPDVTKRIPLALAPQPQADAEPPAMKQAAAALIKRIVP